VEVEVDTAEGLLEVVRKGSLARLVHCTKMGRHTSWSDLVITIRIRVDLENEQKIAQKGCRLQLITMKGCERSKQASCLPGSTRTSPDFGFDVPAFGAVIRALAQKATNARPQQHVPYRDCTLMRIMKEALGGNCKTCMIACVALSDSNHDETNRTLRYAEQAAIIVNYPRATFTSFDK